MKKKILCFGLSSNIGGIEMFIYNFYKEINKEKFDFDFVVFEDNVAFEEEFLANSKIYKLIPRSKNYFKYIYSLILFFFQHNNYDVIHINLMTNSSIEPLILSKLFGKKSIVHSHSEWKGNNIITKILHYLNKPFVMYLSDHRVACSVEAGQWLFGNQSFDIIPNAIEPKLFRFDNTKRDAIRKMLDLEDTFTIGHIGKFVDTKNHTFIIDIFHEIHKVNKNAKLVLVGEGELKSKIHDKICSLNLENSVLLLGKRLDIPELLMGMDAFIFPSVFEGLPISLVEAQATGLNCFVSENITEEIILTNLVQRIKLTNTSEVWANCILSKDIAKKREEFNNTIYKSEFNINNAVKKVEEIYSGSVKGSKEV